MKFEAFNFIFHGSFIFVNFYAIFFHKEDKKVEEADGKELDKEFDPIF